MDSLLVETPPPADYYPDTYGHLYPYGYYGSRGPGYRGHGYQGRGGYRR